MNNEEYTVVPHWPGNGFPIEIFADKKVTRRTELFCCNSASNRPHVLREAVQLTCGHRYCSQCLTDLRGIFPHVECAPCRREGEQDDVRVDAPTHRFLIDFNGTEVDGYASKEISNLAVRCPHGCSEEPLRLKALLSHLEVCPRRVVSCNRCHLELLQNAFSDHSRDHCPEREVECPYGCNIRDLRAKDLENHERSCTAICMACGKSKNMLFEDHRERCPNKRTVVTADCKGCVCNAAIHIRARTNETFKSTLATDKEKRGRAKTI